ncbi:PAS domain S-box protein [Pelagicoccus sp. SDUM812002]|uniref:PAS domain S-box protein n=1 Tax=Pelagicoccus sp. SDUM812002 TaxID=3041266 RepID=UPI00280CE25B|nr:PAS domain S-box protein [Pelagicoccus sp. SDUM812002]MDQ8186479.1 PAS domain S-box protein [Pelagicoccus sp. SDUM812002]
MKHDAPRSKDFLHAVLDTVVDGVIAIDRKGIIQSVNNAAERVFGYESQEIVGKNVNVLMPEPYHSEHDGYLTNFHRTGEAKVMGIAGRELFAKRKDGSVFPIELGISAMEIDTQSLYVGIVRDITERKSAERLTAELKGVMDAVVDGLVTIDDKGDIHSFNPAAERIFGYESSEVAGQNVKVLMPEPYHGEHDGYLHNYRDTGVRKIIGIGREVAAKRKDGSIFPMELAVSEMKVAGKRMFVGIIRDITERKATELERDSLTTELQGIMDAVVDGLITIDEKGCIQTFNPAAERIFGYASEEVAGRNVKVLMPEPYHSEHDGYLDNYHHTGDRKIIGIGREVTAKRKDGTVFPMDLAVSEMRVSGKKTYIGIIRDITERRRGEQERLRMIRQLKDSNQELDDFAYIASHDLKEPLRGLTNNARFLEEDYQDELDEKAVRRLKRMRFLCGRMESLIDDLLYFSRLGRQDLAVCEVDMSKLILEIKLMMQSTLEETNASVVVKKHLPKYTCDFVRTKEVFRNLITNAVKYNESAEKTIEVGYLETWKDLREVFYVRDNGIGIDPEFYEDIFRIFKRLNNESDDSRGTGSGLTFVKKIIERHGGKISLESNLGEGTTFYFTLR